MARRGPATWTPHQIAGPLGPNGHDCRDQQTGPHGSTACLVPRRWTPTAAETPAGQRRPASQEQSTFAGMPAIAGGDAQRSSSVRSSR